MAAEGSTDAEKALLESLPPKVQKRVRKLREIQGQHDALEAKFLEERTALESKYQKLYEPLYMKRNDIVNGVTEVEGAEEIHSDESDGKGVPEFWLNAMKNNDVLAEQITERDEEALKYLKDIKWCRVDKPKGFKIEFFFDSNPFFKNSILSKSYHMTNEDEQILGKATWTHIDWYPGKCLTQKVVKKKPKKGSKSSKPVIKTEACDSFFNFFSPPQVPGHSDDDEAIDVDMAEQLQNQMEQDYDIGITIRQKIIPHAVSWFTGEAREDDIEVVLGEDNEDIDGEDEDDENEEEGKEYEVKSRKMAGGAAA